MQNEFLTNFADKKLISKLYVQPSYRNLVLKTRVAPVIPYHGRNTVCDLDMNLSIIQFLYITINI